MEISQETQKYMELMQKEIDNERARRMQYESDSMQSSGFNSMKEQNLAESQLDLKEEMDRIYHLLSGHIIKLDSEGSEVWDDPKDDRMKIFSEYGVKQIMNIISFYVNKNTLLSNYDAETIIWKVKDFGVELSDLIFNRYEVFFHYPTPEDLFEVYLPILRKESEKFPHLCSDNGNGLYVVNEKALYQKCVQWSQEELKSKLRHYPMIILSLVDTVHSTYLRALGGRERQTLRERINISQNANQYGEMQPIQQRKSSFFRPSTW